MAYSVNWIGKVISIPASDLMLVSGNHYQLPMADFLGEIRRLESDFDEGLWAPQILDHTDSKPDFAGADYAGFDEVINEYSVQFTGAVDRVDLLGSNNNLVDILISTGVSVVPSNSAGLQKVSTGSGLDINQDARLTALHQSHFNKRVWDKHGSTITIYDTDEVTPLHVFDTNSDMSNITPQ